MNVRRLGAPLLLSLMLVMPGTFAGAHAANAATPPQSDIPGIPLPGPVATGQLGGAIYDVVYRFDVRAGYVLLVDLSGSAGTDFDLYVFDSSATTVVQAQGLLARSIGPTSTESLSLVLRQAGTYYIDLNGATDVVGSYRLTVQLAPDLTRPTAHVVLGGGTVATSDSTVSVRLDAFDDLSGISEMAFSEDGTNFYPWQPYRVDSAWTFSPGDGTHTLWAKVRNGVGLESDRTSDGISIDTRPPGILSVEPAQNSIVANLRPTVRVRFTEPIAITSWGQAGIVMQAPSGSIVPGASSFDPTTSTGTFTPDAPLSPGLAYVLTVGQITDLAGNALPVLGSWTLTPQTPTSLTLSAAPGVVVFGAPVTLNIRATGLDDSVVSLESLAPGGGSYATVRALIPVNGRAALTFTPASNMTLRLVFAGSPTRAASTSSGVRVLVRRGVSMVGATPGLVRTGIAGRRVTLLAQVQPAAAGARLSFRRYDYALGTYRYAGSYGRVSGVDGRASLDWTPTSGRHYWRVVVLSSSDYANNIAGPYFWSIAAR